MKPVEAEPYLKTADESLEPLAFRRKKRSQEWRRVVDLAHIEWLHLNFGRYSVINPSLGVEYPDLAALLPTEIGGTFGTMIMLSSITGRSYSTNDEPIVVADALVSALPTLNKLQDRGAVIEALKSENPADWPLIGRSARMRMLPLLLASGNRLHEAFDWLGRFEVVAPNCDQMLPIYDVFARHFRTKYQA